MHAPAGALWRLGSGSERLEDDGDAAGCQDAIEFGERGVDVLTPRARRGAVGVPHLQRVWGRGGGGCQGR